jgi:putative component of membrane protein insertase Oxa1/YidC/SpoIIIJ protein YidD
MWLELQQGTSKTYLADCYFVPCCHQYKREEIYVERTL